MGRDEVDNRDDWVVVAMRKIGFAIFDLFSDWLWVTVFFSYFQSTIITSCSAGVT